MKTSLVAIPRWVSEEKQGGYSYLKDAARFQPCKVVDGRCCVVVPSAQRIQIMSQTILLVEGIVDANKKIDRKFSKHLPISNLTAQQVVGISIYRVPIREWKSGSVRVR